MKQIDAYIDAMYKDMDDEREEIADLKAEMRAHLLDSVLDLQGQGMQEEEAVRVALQRFGDERQIGGGLLEVFQSQKRLAKNLLRTALAFLLAGVLLFSVTMGYTLYTEHAQRAITYDLLEELNGKSELTAADRALIRERFQRYDDLYKDVAVYRVTEEINMQSTPKEGFERFPFAKADYVYPQNASEAPEEGTSLSWGQAQSNGWLLVYTDRARLVPHVTHFEEVIFFFVLVYWVLYAVWATLNAYHRKQFNAAWVVMFALFNVFGYMMFRRLVRRQLHVRHT